MGGRVHARTQVYRLTLGARWGRVSTSLGSLTLFSSQQNQQMVKAHFRQDLGFQKSWLVASEQSPESQFPDVGPTRFLLHRCVLEPWLPGPTDTATPGSIWM